MCVVFSWWVLTVWLAGADRDGYRSMAAIGYHYRSSSTAHTTIWLCFFCFFFFYFGGKHNITHCGYQPSNSVRFFILVFRLGIASLFPTNQRQMHYAYRVLSPFCYSIFSSSFTTVLWMDVQRCCVSSSSFCYFFIFLLFIFFFFFTFRYSIECGAVWHGMEHIHTLGYANPQTVHTISLSAQMLVETQFFCFEQRLCICGALWSRLYYNLERLTRWPFRESMDLSFFMWYTHIVWNWICFWNLERTARNGINIWRASESKGNVTKHSHTTTTTTSTKQKSDASKIILLSDLASCSKTGYR